MVVSKDLVNASVVQKPQSRKKKKKFSNCQICRLEPQLHGPASVSAETEKLRGALTRAATAPWQTRN